MGLFHRLSIATIKSSQTQKKEHWLDTLFAVSATYSPRYTGWIGRVARHFRWISKKKATHNVKGAQACCPIALYWKWEINQPSECSFRIDFRPFTLDLRPTGARSSRAHFRAYFSPIAPKLCECREHGSILHSAQTNFHETADRGKEERYALQINRRTILFFFLHSQTNCRWLNWTAIRHAMNIKKIISSIKLHRIQIDFNDINSSLLGRGSFSVVLWARCCSLLVAF